MKASKTAAAMQKLYSRQFDLWDKLIEAVLLNARLSVSAYIAAKAAVHRNLI